MQKTQEYSVPDWAREIIWYQIFPERFRNGDPSNDPTRERLGTPEGWTVSSWTGDWYERSEWEQLLSDDFRESVYKRRYGGDLQGIIDKLDYLQELGIGGIYLNPVFDAISLHKYDASCYHHVDRFFGPDPKGDAKIMDNEDPTDPDTWQWTSADRLLLELIDEVHQRDMKIIIDGVFNHTGTDFWAFRDLQKNQEQSSYKDWYAVRSFKDPEDPESKFLYNSWWGVKNLPAFNQKNGTLVKPVREHIFNITRRWMDPDGDGDPSDGVDGWRLDVPVEIGKDFWREWNSVVRSVNPNVFTVGELWTTNSPKWINGELFMSSMNYTFAKLIVKYMINRSILTSDFVTELRNLRNSFTDQAEFVLQNLIDSHDTPRLASMIVNTGRTYGKNTKPKEGFAVRKPNAEERRLQKLIALFQYSYVGAPMIYYGTEAGMWGADDPDDRKPMVWEEFDYDPEISHPLDKERPEDDNNFDEQLFNWYKRLGDIRNNHAALQSGEFRELLVDDEHDLFAFSRTLNQKEFCLVAINRSEHSRKISIPLNDFDVSKEQHLQNLVTGMSAEINENKVILKLPPVSGAILAPVGK